MPISNSYPRGIPVEDQDLFVGTKAYNNRTVNYTAQGVADYLNINSKVAIGGQMSFQFTIVPNIPKTIAFEGGFGNNTTFSAITKLIVSAIDLSTANITIFLNYLNNSQILLSEQNQPNFFGHYKITGYTQIGISAFYELDLEFIGGNGTIIDKQYYDLVSFVLSTEMLTTEWGTITGDIEDQTDLINYISSQITIPTLQEVLDNNHDLVDGNNFQGTNAGLGNTGTNVIGIGDGVSQANSGSNVVSIGSDANCTENTGDNVIALGSDTASANSGNNVIAIGFEAVNANTANEVIAIGQSTAQSNSGEGLIAIGTGAGQNNSGINVNAFCYGAAGSNEGNNVNALGNSAGTNNTFNNVNLFGQSATADENGQTVLSKDGTIMARISTTDLTATRKYNLPNASGTIALLSDVGVTSVTATSPITSSGGATPDISTSMATNKLIGRSTAGVGVMEEITIGTGLTLSGGTLNATATSVGFEQNFLLMGS